MALALVATTALAGCGGNNDENKATGRPHVVASTQAWALVARAVAGDFADVTAIVGPGADPHEAQLSAKDTVALTNADIVVANGADYDPYVEKALGDAKGPVVISAEKSQIKTPGLEPKDTSLENEHLFFNFAKVDAVARGLADELAKKDPVDKDAFQKNVKAFDDSLYTFADQLKLLGDKHQGLKVAQTESVGHYLAAYLNATDVTPSGYRDAVAKEVDPAAADEVAMENLLKNKGADLLLSNPQDEDKTLDILIAAAKQGNVPNISIGETPTDKENTYQVWVQGIVGQFISALGGPVLPSDYHHQG